MTNTIVKIESHVENGLARLASQFKGQERIEGFFEAFIRPLEGLETALISTLNNRWVKTAVGKQLDLLGTIVGEKRRGRNDEQYRIGIIIRIAINTSQGTPENAISIFALVTGATIVNLYEYFPGVVEIYGNANFEYSYENYGPESFAFEGGVDGLGFGDVFDPSVGGVFAGIIFHDIDYLYELMDSVLLAGVRIGQLGIFEEDPFGFDGDPANLGFGDVNDSTIGGKFARIVPRP
jgi:hypothetical protein